MSLTEEPLIDYLFAFLVFNKLPTEERNRRAREALKIMCGSLVSTVPTEIHQVNQGTVIPPLERSPEVPPPKHASPNQKEQKTMWAKLRRRWNRKELNETEKCYLASLSALDIGRDILRSEIMDWHRKYRGDLQDSSHAHAVTRFMDSMEAKGVIHRVSSTKGNMTYRISRLGTHIPGTKRNYGVRPEDSHPRAIWGRTRRLAPQFLEAFKIRDTFTRVEVNNWIKKTCPGDPCLDSSNHISGVVSSILNPLENSGYLKNTEPGKSKPHVYRWLRLPS